MSSQGRSAESPLVGFLRTGLRDVGNALDGEADNAEECPICRAPQVEPVETACRHVFCKECVVSWLQDADQNTCPTCRRELFDDVDVDELVHHTWPSSSTSLSDVQMEGISRSLFVVNEGTYSVASTIRRPFGVLHLQRLVPTAVIYILHGQYHELLEPWTRNAPMMVRFSDLTSQVIVMGNLLHGSMSALVAGYEGRQAREWDDIVTYLAQSINNVERNSYLSRHELEARLEADLRERMTMTWGAEVFRVSEFFSDTPTGPGGVHHLDCLLMYLSWWAGNQE